MRLYNTTNGVIVESGGEFHRIAGASWDQVFNHDDLAEALGRSLLELEPCAPLSLSDPGLLAPIGSQEVWAAGVTYYRSRTARMEEAKTGGGSTFYDLVYNAERPELFFKATPNRVAAHGQPVRIRRDSKWNVPEPELTLAVNCAGRIIGYTIGNDMSSRDIEGANPLYLPQAKVYDRSCALGPGLLLAGEALPSSTEIAIEIVREGSPVFADTTTLSRMKRSPEELVEYLFRENTFPNGALLLTGTGIVPPDSFTLEHGDEVRITIEPIGTLVNTVL